MTLIKTTLDAWAERLKGVSATDVVADGAVASDLPTSATHPLHSCIIGGQAHYIHEPGLARQDPDYFERLSEFARRHKITLKADQRSATPSAFDCRRRKLLPIVLLTFGLCAQPMALASDEQHEKATLKLIGESEFSISRDSDELMISLPDEIQATHEAIHSDSEASEYQDKSLIIEQTLREHWVKQDSDPESLDQDIVAMADYYSQHHEAFALISSLSEHKWELKYAPHTFQTDVVGTRMKINTITVYFDPRSGAKLKFYDKCSEKTPFCVASPADALLHELIHANTITANPSQFIAEGGLSGHIYPTEHEHQTIKKENKLYRAMSRRDSRPRPLRNEHTGRHVLVSCVTCYE